MTGARGRPRRRHASPARGTSVRRATTGLARSPNLKRLGAQFANSIADQFPASATAGKSTKPPKTATTASTKTGEGAPGAVAKHKPEYKAQTYPDTRWPQRTTDDPLSGRSQSKPLLGSGRAKKTPTTTEGPNRASRAGFKAPKTFSNRHGQLTNGEYTLDAKGMEPHATGSLKGGKSQFWHGVNERQLALDAAAYADDAGLWVGNKAKIILDTNIGVHAGTGQLTRVINVYRNKNGFVHAAPGTPIP